MEKTERKIGKRQKMGFMECKESKKIKKKYIFSAFHNESAFAVYGRSRIHCKIQNIKENIIYSVLRATAYEDSHPFRCCRHDVPVFLNIRNR